MRPVEYFKYSYEHGKQKLGEAKFHQFGVDYDDNGSYSTAIIELENGAVLNHPVEMIRFLDFSPVQTPKE